MPCEELQADLSAFADGEADEVTSARVARHVAACAECRASLGAWRELGVRMRAEDETPEESARVRAAVDRALAEAALEPPAPRVVAVRRWPFVTLASAAAALLAVALLYPRAHAEDEVRRLVELDELNRVESMRLLGGTEALRLEITSLSLRARAADLDRERLAELDTEAARLLEDTQRLTQRLALIRGSLAKGGLQAR